MSQKKKIGKNTLKQVSFPCCLHFEIKISCFPDLRGGGLSALKIESILNFLDFFFFFFPPTARVSFPCPPQNLLVFITDPPSV